METIKMPKMIRWQCEYCGELKREGISHTCTPFLLKKIDELTKRVEELEKKGS